MSSSALSSPNKKLRKLKEEEQSETEKLIKFEKTLVKIEGVESALN